MPSLSIRNAKGECLKQVKHPQEPLLYYQAAYAPGDEIYLTLDEPSGYCWISVDQAVAPALVYLPQGWMAYTIPQGEAALAYPPQAFAGDKHLISLRLPQAQELAGYRNLAENPADQRGDTNAYPHASANVETRNESVFAARNVIDGCRASDGHGPWPYQSWGIGGRDDAYLTLSFGRNVWVNRVAFCLRADFPHDAYWTAGVLVLSDGTEHPLRFEKTGDPQAFDIGEHVISWLRIERLIKCDLPSAFPALIELAAFGRDILG